MSKLDKISRIINRGFATRDLLNEILKHLGHKPVSRQNFYKQLICYLNESTHYRKLGSNNVVHLTKSGLFRMIELNTFEEKEV